MTLRRADAAERRIVEPLWQVYVHDLSEFSGAMPEADGGFKRDRLAAFFDDPEVCCYLIHDGSAVAGFAVVNRLLRGPRGIAAYFVVRGARGCGVGHAAALALLGTSPGRWEIAFQEANAGAGRFWRKVATGAVGEAWAEERRPVPGKPHLPPDSWITLTI